MFRMVSTLKLFAKDLTKFADVSVNLLICPTLSKWFSVGNAHQSTKASLVNLQSRNQPKTYGEV